MIKLMQGDCLERMKEIPDGSVDMILTDPPYGTTACKWDSIIPLEPMWEQLKRIVKSNGAIVLFSQEPFTSILICSNLKWFKYRLDWDKVKPSGMVYAKYRPMQQSEDVCIFTKDGKKSVYNPQMTLRDVPVLSKNYGVKRNDVTQKGVKPMAEPKLYTHKNPTTRLVFSNSNQRGKVHPTQKPVALMEYLIKTYTNEGETVLDFTMGSGTTGVACVNLNRSFIGIELDESYFKIAEARING